MVIDLPSRRSFSPDVQWPASDIDAEYPMRELIPLLATICIFVTVSMSTTKPICLVPVCGLRCTRMLIAL
jgi:hypothetical protein